MLKRFIKKIVRKIINWCISDEISYGDVFNSMRIDALVSELSDKGVITNHEYETQLNRKINLVVSKVVA